MSFIFIMLVLLTCVQFDGITSSRDIFRLNQGIVFKYDSQLRMATDQYHLSFAIPKLSLPNHLGPEMQFCGQRFLRRYGDYATLCRAFSPTIRTLNHRLNDVKQSLRERYRTYQEMIPRIDDSNVKLRAPRAWISAIGKLSETF